MFKRCNHHNHQPSQPSIIAAINHQSHQSDWIGLDWIMSYTVPASLGSYAGVLYKRPIPSPLYLESNGHIILMQNRERGTVSGNVSGVFAFL